MWRVAHCREQFLYSPEEMWYAPADLLICPKYSPTAPEPLLFVLTRKAHAMGISSRFFFVVMEATYLLSFWKPCGPYWFPARLPAYSMFEKGLATFDSFSPVSLKTSVFLTHLHMILPFIYQNIFLTCLLGISPMYWSNNFLSFCVVKEELYSLLSRLA